jgi:hypothetical protein
MLSPDMPQIPYSPPIEDLLSNFAHNWHTLGPVLWVLFGTLFGTFLVKKVINKVRGD